MPHHRHFYSSSDSDSDSKYGPGIQVINRPAAHRRRGSHHDRHSPERQKVYAIAADGLLAVNDQHAPRHRSASTNGRPQPMVIKVENVLKQDNNQQGGSRSPSYSPSRSRSHERRRRAWDRSRSRRRSSPSSEEEEVVRIRRRPGRPRAESEFHYHLHGGSRSPSPIPTYKDPFRGRYDYDTRKKLDKLKLYEEEQEEEERKKEIKLEIERAKVRELFEKQEKEAKEKELRKKFVEDWKREEDEKKAKAKKQKEEEDVKFEERFKLQLMTAGYSAEHIESILHQRKEKKIKEKENMLALDVGRPTYIKVNRKWLSPQTLEHFRLPWGYDEDDEFIIIKRWISHELQEELFEHTRKLKSRKLIMGPVEKETVTTLKVKDQEKDKMYLVRKRGKSPGRGAWIFS